MYGIIIIQLIPHLQHTLIGKQAKRRQNVIWLYVRIYNWHRAKRAWSIWCK